MTASTCLTSKATTIDVYIDIILLFSANQNKWLLNNADKSVELEVFFNWEFVDNNLSLTSHNTNTSNGLFSTASSPNLFFLICYFLCHNILPFAFKSNLYRLLSLMTMILVLVYSKFFDHFSSEVILRKHTLNS